MELKQSIQISKTCLIVSMVIFILVMMSLQACTATLPLPSPSETGQPTQIVPTATHTRTCTVTTGVPDGSLNVRFGAGTQHPVWDTAKEGQTFAVWAEKDGWYRVNRSMSLWVNSKFCQ